jgi:hypothetical protein
VPCCYSFIVKAGAPSSDKDFCRPETSKGRRPQYTCFEETHDILWIEQRASLDIDIPWS